MAAQMKTRANLTMLTSVVLPSLLLAACGQQGPLYLPDEARDIVTRPVQTPQQPPEPGAEAQAPNSPQTVDSPVPVPPAPEVSAPEPDASDETNKKNGSPPPPK
jgi:predicted small lipoprotein YifL